MAKPRLSAGGGLPAVAYVLQKALEVGPWRLYSRLRSRNACKTCALGMGGQRGGMVNEAGHFPEVCKKSVQAQAGDMTRVLEERDFASRSIADLAKLTSAEFERLGRLAFPVIAEERDTHFRRISWDEAYDRAAAAFHDAQPEETFVYASGRSSNEAAFLLQIAARAYGTTNIHNCSYYCHQASGVALSRVYGSGTSSITLEDLAKADLAIVAGANPASNHPRLITQLVNLRMRGGKVIAINPLLELGLVRFRVPSIVRSLLFGSKVSDLYLQPHAGGDAALLKALLKGVVETGGVDDAFVSNYTAGWEEIVADLASTSWESLLDASGVPRRDIDDAVRLIGESKRGVALWAMGLTHHANGVDNVQALANLALSRGWLGTPGCGLLPIRGHSNVQGVGSMGVSPKLRKAFAEKLESVYGITGAGDGQDTYASMVAAHEGRMRAALFLGGNLFASNPDRAWSSEALQRIDATVAVTTKLNEGHVHGRGRTAIILPVLARDEEAQATTQESMFNFVRLSDGGRPSIRGDLRSEVEVIASLAERILPPGRFDWTALRSHARLRDAIAQVVPGYEAISQVEESGEFQIGGRTFHEPQFRTEDGKAHFAVTPVAPRGLADDELMLMTIRSEGQFNTVVYEEEDAYRGNRRRDVVMLAPSDAKRRGISEGQAVVVETEVGSLKAHAAIVDIRAGNIAMYYPEANALVPRHLDPQSKTPAFKSVRAMIR